MADSLHNRKEIVEQINNSFADNEEQQITAEDLRTVSRDYLGQGAGQPVLIYSGYLRPKTEIKNSLRDVSARGVVSYPSTNTKTVTEAKIIDMYIDMTFFRAPRPTKPTDPINLFSINDTKALSGKPDGEYMFSDTGRRWRVKLTVVANLITRLDVVDKGRYMEKGYKKTFSNPSGSGDLIFTYNSIMVFGGVNSSGHFSFGSSNGSENNTRDNCIISVQGTEIGASQSIGRFTNTSNNFLVYATIVKETTKQQTGTSGGRKSYRYTTKTGGALSAVTIWKIPTDDISAGGGTGDSDGVNTNPET